MSKNLVPWPEDWPVYRQSSESCDMLVGPCCCGAWHQPGEFELIENEEYTHMLRFGEAVYWQDNRMMFEYIMGKVMQ